MRLTSTRKAPVTVACPGLLRGADIKGDVGTTREAAALNLALGSVSYREFGWGVR